MTITQRATWLYSVQDKEFKEELLRLLNIMADEITDLKGEVQALERQIDDHNMYKH
jgi:hypothetical protein